MKQLHYIYGWDNFILEGKNYQNIYHFTHIDNLIFILTDEVFFTRYNDLKKYNYDFAISTTRNRSFQWGVVRIELDASRISHNYEIRPVSYFKFNKTQSEERIFTNEEIFPIFKYIIKIDILKDRCSEEDINFILDKCNSLKIECNIINSFKR